MVGVGQMGSLKSYGISGYSLNDEYLSLLVYGSTAGTFPYRLAEDACHDVSQVTLRTKDGVFTNYKALMCPTSLGYHSTIGQVVVDEYVPGKLARGTFSGTLFDANDPNQCNKKGKSFSGEFCVTQHWR